jgi:paraquat-inducible protein B
MRALAAGLAAASLLLAACGGKSAEQKAQDNVCSARADIERQLTTLQNLPLSTTSIDTAQKALAAIKRDLQSIASAQSHLSAQRKQQVQTATQTFKGQLSSLARTFTTLPPAQALAQAQTSFDQLAAGYKRAFAPISC